MKPSPTLADWRALAEKELAGADFEKTLVHTTAEGLRVEPLYVETSIDPGLPGAPPFLRGTSASGPGTFQLCMRVGRTDLADDIAGGADALWLDAGDDEALTAALGHGLGAIVEAGVMSATAALEWFTPYMAGSRTAAGSRTVALAVDPISAAARGHIGVDAIAGALAALGNAATISVERFPGMSIARASTVPFHDAGADAADEIALAMSSGVAALRALVDAGIAPAAAARLIGLQVAVGRDTFGELCKLRALRLCWHKVLAAAGAPDVAPRPLHAVCSARTQSQRDPWVNMLRVTTEVFAAALGGAELVTPLAFDEALGAASELGRRVARNTALVLREESHLGRVVDPAGGSYYIEARTDALAREAWARFTAIERDGGIVKLLASGALRERLEAAWAKRSAAIAQREEPILGVSEFANPGEKLPAPIPRPAAPPAAPALVPHRDAEAFEAAMTNPGDAS